MTAYFKFSLSLALVALLGLAGCNNDSPIAAKDAQQVVLPQPLPLPERPKFDPAAPSVAQIGYLDNANVRQFIAYEAEHDGLDFAALNTFFAQAAYKANIIDIMNRPGTSLPWYRFAANNAGQAKILAGQSFYRSNQQAIDAAAVRYGVPAEVIVAIVGIETNYGRNMGSFRVGDALATLGFAYPRRADYFQGEVVALLQMANEERRDPMSFMGSYAGAMGMPQFMPSSYRQWAVDFDGDGQRNIWTSVPDVAASVANYLKAHGWQTGGRVMIPVSLTLTPELAVLIDEKTALNHTVGDLRRMGVVPQENVRDDEKAVLFRLETAPDQFAYYIGLNNFYTIWQYNHSRLYVSAVRNIANGVGNSRL